MLAAAASIGGPVAHDGGPSMPGRSVSSAPAAGRCGTGPATSQRDERCPRGQARGYPRPPGAERHPRPGYSAEPQGPLVIHTAGARLPVGLVPAPARPDATAGLLMKHGS